jgi:dUTP pyrophosphatase
MVKGVVYLIKRFMKKLFDWVYGFDVSQLNPYQPLDVYFYNTSGRVPTYQTKGAVGADVYAELGDLDQIVLKPGDMYKIPTGMYIELPEHYGGLLYSRSGLSSNGLLLTNGVGVIDFDYRGQVHFPVKNISDQDIIIRDGERIGQLLLFLIKPVNFIQVESVDDLSKTERGSGGFGSTGLL